MPIPAMICLNLILYNQNSADSVDVVTVGKYHSSGSVKNYRQHNIQILFLNLILDFAVLKDGR